jgi:hypothetical protein
MDNNDYSLLAAALTNLLGRSGSEPFRTWADPATNVLDCVLSLNRRYDGFVLPRLNKLAERHPDSWVWRVYGTPFVDTSLPQLSELLNSTTTMQRVCGHS